MQATKPQQEHQWLEKLVGDWTYGHESPDGHDQSSECTFTGTQRTRSIGGLWIVGEGQGKMPDGSAMTMIITLGFDHVKKRFVGTFIGSMGTNLWVYDGALDSASKVLTLDAEGPDFTVEGKTAKYQDIIEIVDNDHHILHSQTLGDDGKWHRFMTAHYRRKK